MFCGIEVQSLQVEMFCRSNLLFVGICTCSEHSIFTRSFVDLNKYRAFQYTGIAKSNPKTTSVNWHSLGVC